MINVLWPDNRIFEPVSINPDPDALVNNFGFYLKKVTVEGEWTGSIILSKDPTVRNDAYVCTGTSKLQDGKQVITDIKRGIGNPIYRLDENEPVQIVLATDGDWCNVRCAVIHDGKWVNTLGTITRISNTLKIDHKP